MSTTPKSSFLNRKITDLPAWSSFLQTGLLGVEKKSEGQIRFETRIEQIEKNQTSFIGVAEKNANLMSEIVINTKLNYQRIEMPEKRLDELTRKLEQIK